LAFNNGFPAAETANNIAHLQLHEAVALGAGGPTQATTHAYNAYTGGIPIKLQSGFAYAGVPVLGNERMLVADLTSLHAARIANGDYAKDGFSGSHSDISSPEIYNLIAGFAFQ
jgi:hypothetical protein